MLLLLLTNSLITVKVVQYMYIIMVLREALFCDAHAISILVVMLMPHPGELFVGLRANLFVQQGYYLKTVCVLYTHMLSQSLKWNRKMAPWKKRFLFETTMFRFHVKLSGHLLL